MRGLVPNVVAITIAVLIFTSIVIPEIEKAEAFMDDTAKLVADVLPIILIVAILVACARMLFGQSRY